MSTIPQTVNPDPTLSNGDSSATIISMLNKLSESKLLARVESIEQRQDSDRIHTNQISGSVTANQTDADLAPDVMLAGARAQDIHPRVPARLGVQGCNSPPFPGLKHTLTKSPLG